MQFRNNPLIPDLTLSRQSQGKGRDEMKGNLCIAFNLLAAEPPQASFH